MKTSLAIRFDELIRNTNDKQFLCIYKDFLSFKRKHFVEFVLMRKISLLDDIANIIEMQMEERENIENLANEKVGEIFEEEPKEAWKKNWKEENEVKQIKPQISEFKKVLLYVIGFHVCVVSTMFFYSILFSEEKPDTKYQQMQEVYYPESTKVKGPVSDSITNNKRK
jgi:regulator of replication initiation timing